MGRRQPRLEGDDEVPESIYLLGERAHGEVLSIAFAGDGQHQDAGGKIIHAAPNTTSLITSKSISKGTGRTSYRGLVKVYPGCEKSKSTVRCDALILDEEARSDTYPYMEIDEEDVTIGHEATVSKVGSEQLFYLMSRGLVEAEATAMIVNGFIEPIVKELPMEYAVEMNRLIQLQMEGAVGWPMTTATAPRRSTRTRSGASATTSTSPDWLRDLRAGWWERAEATPPPTGQEEEWRRTDLAGLPRDGELLLDPPALEVTCRPAPPRRGVILTDLRTAVREHPDLVRRSLGPGGGPASHAHFWALAHAAWTGGLFCYVPRGVAVDGTLVARTTLPLGRGHVPPGHAWSWPRRTAASPSSRRSRPTAKPAGSAASSR